MLLWLSRISLFSKLSRETVVLFIGYITNNAFPQPLSEEEENYYLERLFKGDPEARNTIIEHNLRLVAHVCKKKFEGASEENEDMISIGSIGLIKAIDAYDPTKGTRLATFAARCIENEILMHLRSLKKHRGKISINEPIGVDKEGNEITLTDVLGTENDMVTEDVENRLEQKRIIEQMKKLNKREKYVLELRFGLFTGLRNTQREIAKALGISRSYVSRIEKKAIEKLIKELNL
jgi:RNA polymerase sporulation-specific sigma factor